MALIKDGTLNLNTGFDFGRSCVLDYANNKAYIGLFGTPGKIARVNMLTFAQDAGLTLSSTGDLQYGDIDTVNGFVYFITGQTGSTGTVYKVSTSSFTEISSLTIAGATNGFSAMAIDVGAQKMYVLEHGTTPPTLHRIDLGTFSVDATLPMPASFEANDPSSFRWGRRAIIDTANGFLYIGSTGTDDKIVKITLSSFSITSSLVNAFFQKLICGEIDTVNNKLYFMSRDNVVLNKINLSGFTFAGQIGGWSVNSGISMTISTTKGELYVMNGDLPSTEKSVDTAAFAIKDTLNLISSDGRAGGGRIDPTTGISWWVGSQVPARSIKTESVILPAEKTFGKIQLNYVQVGGVTKVAIAKPTAGTARLSGIAIDTVHQQAYCVSDNNPSKIIQFSLSAFIEIRELTTAAGSLGRACVLDPVNQFAYFGSTTANKISRINLQDFTETVLDVGGTRGFNAAIIDVTGGFAYFLEQGSSSPIRLYKIDLSTFTQSGSALDLTVAAGDFQSGSMDIDLVNNKGYAASRNSSFQRLVKIDLSTMTVDSANLLPNPQIAPLTGVWVDVANNNLYVGGRDGTPAGVINRYVLSTQVFSDSVSLFTGTGGGLPIKDGIKDLTNGFLYLSTQIGASSSDSQMRITAVELVPFRERGHFDFATNEYHRSGVAIDVQNKFCYWPGYDINDSNIGLLAKTTNFFQQQGSELIDGKTQVALMKDQPINGTIVLSAKVDSGVVQGTDFLEVVATKSVAGKCLLEARQTASIAGSCLLELSETDYIAGDATLAAVASQKVKGSAFLSVNAAQSIKGKTILLGTTSKSIAGSCALAVKAFEEIAGTLDLISGVDARVTGKMLLVGTNFTGTVVDQFSPNQSGGDSFGPIDLVNWVGQGFVPTLRNVKQVFLVLNTPAGPDREVFVRIRNNIVVGLENRPNIDISPIIQRTVSGGVMGQRVEFTFMLPVGVNPGSIYHIVVSAGDTSFCADPGGYTLAPASKSVDGGVTWFNVP